MPVVNRKSRFKRSFPTKEEQKILKKARVEAASLTSPEFKVLLSNSASTIVAFERFNSYVKEFGQRSEKEQRTSYDLIAEYLVSSPECKEIFNVISNKDLYSKFEIYHILKTLDSLLTALLKSSYKERFPSSAENICKQLAEGHFQKIYGLIISGKGRTNTTSIQLLTTVTAHGSLTTRLLFTNISFVREDIDALYNEKAVARLRQPFIKFLLSMIEHASPPVLKAIIDEKGLLNGMFGLLHTDTSELIEQVLSVLDKYVLSSTFITKTQRVKLFNITTVPQILECYNWHKSVKREKESTSQSEKPKVQSIVCEFVKSLLSNPKKCITFSDPEFGTGSRNMNHVVTHILVKSVLNNAYNDSQLEEVVVACLASRPDQLHRYLAVLEDSALPVKNTESWLTAANHVIKLMYSLPTFGHLVKHARTTSDDTLCNIALALSSPGLSTMKIFKHVLSMPELSWQYTALGLLLVVMNRAKDAVATVRKDCSKDRYEAWHSLFVERFMQLMPHVDVIQQCWSALKKTFSTDEFKTGRKNLAGRILDVLTLYLELCPHSIYQSTMPINISAILQDIETMCVSDSDDVEEHSSEFAGLAVKALKLLGELGNEAGLSAIKMRKGQRSTLLMILKIIEGETDADIRTQARELLVKQLKQTGWFEKLDSELDVWLEHSSKLDSVEFLEKILSTLFSNPYPYLDTVCQVVTGVSEHKKQGRTIDNKPLPFSPLVPIALKHSEEVDQSDDIRSYVHTCLSAILLRQDNPLPLASLLSTHRKSGLSLVSDVILGTKKAKVGKCSLGPEGDMWELFFLLDWGSRDAAKLREAVLKQVEQQTSAVEQETACHYCLLALWHCQETGKEEEMTSYVGDLLLTIRDSVLVAEKLIQSGVVLKWYMGDDSESSTFYHITKLCNSVLKRIQASQIKELKAQTEIFRTRLLSKLRNVEKHDDKLTLLILRSTTIFAPAFSSADLLHVLNFLIGTEAALLETYSTCLEVCVQTFTSRPVTTSAEIAQRLSIIDSLVKMESGYKYKMLLIALTNTCAPDVIYFHVWAECLQTADSDDADAAAASDLLVYLIRESVTDDFVLRLLPLLNKSQTDKLLPVVHEIIGRVSDDSTVKHFASLWKPLANKLKGFDGSSHCEQAATVLSHLAPHVKEKNVMNLANSLLSSEGLLAAQPLLILLLRLSKHHPELYVQVFSLVNDNMSKLTFQAVELIGKELSAISMPENIQVEIKQLIAGRWKELIFSALRKNYDSESWLRLVTTLTRIVYGTTAKPVEMNLSPSDMFQLLTNHSKFLPVVMCNHATSSLLSKAKGELLTLLTLLVELSPSICSADHYPIWLSAYQATMSTNDRKLLRLMYLYETSGVSTLKYRPYIWGATASTHYSIKQNVTPSLISQPSVDIVLESLDKELLRQSAYNLPLQRALSHQQDSPSSATESHDFDEKLYDPAFLLPLFAYIMRPDNTLDTRQLVGDGIITYIICCLTSHVEDVRAAARFILYEFRQHLESSVYSESVQGLYILDLLKESIQLENARISPIIAVFIAKTLQNIPDEHMYKVCHNYLLIKPRMDLDSVPEFFRLFYSSSQEFAVERSWMLQLLLTSLREDSDFRMYEKLNIFKAIMAYGQCQLCSSDDRVVILEVITKSCTLSTAYQTVIKYNILGWLSSMIISFPQVAMPALKCFHAMVSRQLTEKSWFEVFCTQLVTTLISIMKRVRITEVEGSLFTEILYRSLAMRRTVRLKNFSSSESVEGLAAVAPVSPCESEAIVRYLPRVNSDYELKVLRLAHVQSTSS